MFFIMGISNGNKKLNYVQTMLCSACGQFGRYEVFMSYMYFSLFFIPIFKWNRRYYVKSTCCNRHYEIDAALGKRIRRGENITLREEDLHAIGGMGSRPERCPNCGYPVTSDFSYCPGCGTRL